MIQIEQPQLDPQQEFIVDPLDLPEDPFKDIIEEDDGSAVVPMLDELFPPTFDENLAERLPESYLNNLAQDLLEKIDKDKIARKRRDELYEEGIRRTGLGNDAPGGAQFNGASRAVHPVMAESCIDFAARAIKELFPATGPVKVEAEALIPPELETQVKQLALCLNNQFVHEIPEYRSVQEQVLTQLPLGGSQYVKFSVNDADEKIDVEFVPIDDIFIPFNAPNFYSASRQTHRQYVSQDTYEERVENATYRDLRVIAAINEPERSDAASANDKIEGKDSSGMNEDGDRTVYEVYTKLSIEEDEFSGGRKSPYIIAIDEYENKIISIRRNWEEQDERRKTLQWIVEDTFIPWRGAQGIGLPHLIGGLAGAATGALRALLDSAHINNAPTLLKLKGSRINGTTQSVAVTQIADIEGPVNIDDIRKYIMPMPFNAPSPVLMQLLGWLTDASKGVVSTASEKIADATSNTPVGTVQALIEQGAVIFSSIHARLHFSQAKKFEIVLRILKSYFPQKLQEYGLNPQVVTMRGIHPASDPRVFSEAQRFAQAQGVLQLAEKAQEDPRVKYDMYELHRSVLSLMKIDNLDRILPPPPKSEPQDPATELVSIINNKNVITIPEMDHASHINVHLAFLKDPMCGGNPIMIPITIKVLEHLKEHIAHFFAARLQTITQQQLGTMQGVRPEQLMAQASEEIIQVDMAFASEALTIIEEVDKFVRTTMMSQNPEMEMIKVQAEAQEKSLELQYEKQNNDLRIKTMQEENRQNRTMFEQALDQRKQEHDELIDRLKLQLDANASNVTQQVEMLKNEMDNQQKQTTELLKNRDDNRTNLIIEQMKLALTEVKPIDQEPDDKKYLKDLEGVIEKAKNAQFNEQMSLIMEGLKETISASRAPRTAKAIRDENGKLVAARSEIE